MINSKRSAALTAVSRAARPTALLTLRRTALWCIPLGSARIVPECAGTTDPVVCLFLRIRRRRSVDTGSPYDDNKTRCTTLERATHLLWLLGLAVTAVGVRVGVEEHVLSWCQCRHWSLPQSRPGRLTRPPSESRAPAGVEGLWLAHASSLQWLGHVAAAGSSPAIQACHCLLARHSLGRCLERGEAECAARAARRSGMQRLRHGWLAGNCTHTRPISDNLPVWNTTLPTCTHARES